MNRFSFIFLVLGFISLNVFAADDPMVSLFRFQSQMANTGNVEAMMKLAEMYEEGVGTKQNLDLALKTYRQAWEKGAKGAAASIKRVEQEKKNGSVASNRARQQKLIKAKVVREKAMREKAARQKAAREKAARDKAKRDKAAREKVLIAKLARDKAIKEKATREKAAREKAMRDKAARAKVAREKAARDKARQEQVARAQAAEKKAVAEKAAREQVVRQKKIKKKTFTADPCNTPAARFISNCRKR